MEGGLQAALRAIVVMSDAWLALVGRTRESLLGRSLFDVFPPDPSDPGGQARTRRAMEQAIADKRPYSVPAHRYTLIRDGKPAAARMWTSTEIPVLDREGAVQYLLHRLVDVTEQADRQRDLDR